MFRRGTAAALCAMLILPLAGCWDIKDIQDINYLTAIGFDYDDGEYVVYAQLLDFTSVAKSEAGKPNQPVPVWVGTGKGPTLIAAFNNLYQTSQMRIFYGQIQTVVFSESILKHGRQDAKDLLNRYYEMRYTPWVFATKESIGKVFTATPFFNLSPLMSLLHQPQETYRQQSMIAPIKMLRFTSEFREPGNSVALPSLALSREHWKSGGTPRPMLEIDGCFVFQNENYRGWFSKSDLPGLRWVQTETRRSPILIRSAGKPQVALSLEKPKIKIKPQVRDHQVSYSLHVKLAGIISEVLESIPEPELKERAEQEVENQIRQTFETGLRKGVDLLHLEHELYQRNNRLWRKVHRPEGTSVTPDSLKDIQVDIRLKHAGKLKY